jgi:hypothetical protein
MIVRRAARAVHERFRDLEDVDRQRAQAGQRRVAGAEVVERDPHPQRAQRREHRLRRRHLRD